ncbi:MAG: Calx-beta domain-containing protein, partial [Dolichospermum sp.]
YTFSNLGPGEYAILEVNQTGWIQTFPTIPYALNLTAGENLTGINFGNYFQLPTINLSPSNQTVVEGLTTPQNASYTVTLSQASNQTVSVNYATANGTATAGLDYTATNGTLTFAPGATSQVINIPILNDSFNEADETFTLTLSSPTNAILGAGTAATTTITDTLTASVTTTLPANVENLTGINFGGLGNDIAGFQFEQSPVSGADRITDFAIGTDRIDLLNSTGGVLAAPTSFARAADSTATTLANVVNSVFTDANGALVGNQALG